MLDLVEKIKIESKGASAIIHKAVGIQIDILKAMNKKNMRTSLISKITNTNNGSTSATMGILLKKGFVSRKKNHDTKKRMFLYTITESGKREIS